MVFSENDVRFAQSGTVNSSFVGGPSATGCSSLRGSDEELFFRINSPFFLDPFDLADGN